MGLPGYSPITVVVSAIYLGVLESIQGKKTFDN